MALPEMLAGVSLAGSIFGAKAQKKTWQRYFDYMQQLGAPGRRALGAALPGLEEVALRYLMPRLGKPSLLLGAAYKKSAEGITKAGERNVRRSMAYWKGNVGRGRAEQMKARLATRSALGELALGYGRGQEEYKAGTTREVTAALSQLGSLGVGAMQPAMAAGQAILGKGEAAQEPWMDFASALGEYAGWWQWKQLMKA